MSKTNEYQTFLKIISWEDYHRICSKRKFGRICSVTEDKNKSCTSPDKDTMLRCPIWKDMRNFYGNKVWHQIKRKEVNHVKVTEEEKSKIARRCRENGKQHLPVKGRFEKETFKVQ